MISRRDLMHTQSPYIVGHFPVGETRMTWKSKRIAKGTRKPRQDEAPYYKFLRDLRGEV